MTRTPRRLQRSARIPEGTSSSGTAAAYTAAISPIVAGEKPISSRNSFSTGTHRAMPPVNAAASSGANRFCTVIVPMCYDFRSEHYDKSSTK